MRWYSAQIILKRDLAGCAERLWEEKIFVIQGDTEEEIRSKLEGILKKEEMSYLNLEGGMVQWSLQGVPAIEELLDESIVSGTEVYSRFLMESEIKCRDEFFK